MKRSLLISLAIAAVLLMSAMPGEAGRGYHGGGRGWGLSWGPVVGLGLGLGLLGLSYPYYGYPYHPEYNRYPDYYPAAVIEQPSAGIYLQPAPQQPVTPTYWYYCRDPEGYYPYVKQCPGGWMKVVPSAPTP